MRNLERGTRNDLTYVTYVFIISSIERFYRHWPNKDPVYLMH